MILTPESRPIQGRVASRTAGISDWLISFWKKPAPKSVLEQLATELLTHVGKSYFIEGNEELVRKALLDNLLRKMTDPMEIDQLLKKSGANRLVNRNYGDG